MDDILLIQLLKKKGIITDRDMHEFHELTEHGLQEPVYITERYNEHQVSEDSNTITEAQAVEMVQNMYHIENNRKYIGEKFNIYKAKELCQKYKNVLPKTITYIDIYLAINMHYHNYICLFKKWFSDMVDIECKIVESAIVYWFMDDDFKYEDKIQKLFK